MKESSGEDNKPNRRVEDVFREGFEGAQAPPPARLWDKLDQALENQELKHYRAQAFWYRSVAAACLLLLLTAGVYLWRQDKSLLETGQGQLANAPAAKSNPSEGASGVNQNAINKSGGEKTTKETSVFGSISEKQAKNEMASNVTSREADLSAGQVATDESSQLGFDKVQSATNKYKAGSSASIASSRSTKGRSLFKVSVGEEKGKPDNLAIATVTSRSEEITNDDQLRAIGELSSTSETINALQPLRTPSSSLASAQANNTNNTDSLDTRVATILLQEEASDRQMAKVAVEPMPSVQSDKQGPQKGWIVSLAYTPLYAHAPIAVADAPSREGIRMSEEQQQMYQQYDQALQEYRESYSPAYSYSAKLGAGYQLNDHWQIETGFLYGQNEATTTHSFLITKADNVMRINSAVPHVNRPEPIVKVAFEPELANNLEAVTPTDKFKTRYKYQQVGVPLRIAYHKSISKVFAFVSGGVNLHLLLNNRIESDNQDVQAKRYHYKDEASPFRAWQWAAATSAGIGYQVNSKMSLTVAPELTYSFSSALKESQTQADPYQVGVSIGGKYRLSK